MQDIGKLWNDFKPPNVLVHVNEASKGQEGGEKDIFKNIGKSFFSIYLAPEIKYRHKSNEICRRLI